MPPKAVDTVLGVKGLASLRRELGSVVRLTGHLIARKVRVDAKK